MNPKYITNLKNEPYMYWKEYVCVRETVVKTREKKTRKRTEDKSERQNKRVLKRRGKKREDARRVNKKGIVVR